jgi:hypothetical protein
MRGLFFHDAQETARRNSTLRTLDQWWRVKQRQREGPLQEVILVARLKPRQGPAAAITRDPASPSQLWFRASTDPNAARVPPDGSLRQETYVRIFIPVQP